MPLYRTTLNLHCMAEDQQDVDDLIEMMESRGDDYAAKLERTHYIIEVDEEGNDVDA